MPFSEYVAANNHLYTGRASAAIYLALCANNIRNAQVLLPANICYAAVLPILYTGNTPVFADVGSDGNLTLETVAVAQTVNLRAAVLPHMYGNPCHDIAAICHLLAERGVLTIEDCSLAMGTRMGAVMTGTFGDYAVYSFGYSKTIDCGHGGMIVSARNLDQLATLNEELDEYAPPIEGELRLFSQVYRLLRNNSDGTLERWIYGGVLEDLRRCFLYRTTTAHATVLRGSLTQLDTIIHHRREHVRLYTENLVWRPEMEPYAFDPGAVPWRYNILVDERRRPGLITHLLRQHVAVSDWYPVIAPMFGIHQRFPQAERMERRILNFPLLGVDAVGVQNIARTINEFWKGQGD